MDIADATQRSLEVLDKHAEQNIRRQAAMIPIGEPGECAECGDFNPRLVTGICSPCRDFLAELKRKY